MIFTTSVPWPAPGSPSRRHGASFRDEPLPPPVHPGRRDTRELDCLDGASWAIERAEYPVRPPRSVQPVHLAIEVSAVGLHAFTIGEV